MYTDLPKSLDTPRARVRLQLLAPDYRDRLIAARRKMEDLGVTPARLSDRFGRVTESDRGFVRAVLGGISTSAPLLDQVETELEAIAAERATSEYAVAGSDLAVAA